MWRKTRVCSCLCATDASRVRWALDGEDAACPARHTRPSEKSAAAVTLCARRGSRLPALTQPLVAPGDGSERHLPSQTLACFSAPSMAQGPPPRHRREVGSRPPHTHGRVSLGKEAGGTSIIFKKS